MTESFLKLYVYLRKELGGEKGLGGGEFVSNHFFVIFTIRDVRGLLDCTGKSRNGARL